MKKKYYHGTSYDNLDSILQHGLSGDEPKLWQCSCDYVYAWDPEHLAREEYYEDNPDYDFIHNIGMERAFESAQFALADAKTCRAIIVEFEANDIDMEPDDSCEYMYGAFQTKLVKPEQITRIFISTDLSLLRFHFIQMHINRDMSSLDLNPKIEHLVKSIKAEIYPEDINDIVEWEEHPLPNTMKKAS